MWNLGKRKLVVLSEICVVSSAWVTAEESYKMDRFEHAEARLTFGENFIIREQGVKLYDGDEKTTFEGGEIVLTSHRLLWGRPGDIQRGLTCLSLPLRYVVFVEEEAGGGSFGFSRSKKIVLHLSEALPGKIPGPVNRSIHHYVKLSFKEGLENNFLKIINETIQNKKWESFSPAAIPSQAPNIKLRTGIVGIERGIQEKQKATDESISRAFQDLNKLMDMAKDMVNLSKSISQKIRERQGDITEDETVRFKSYLLSLGIDDPVTRNDFRSESQYYKELARQLADILEQPIREVGGMMALTDVYCRVNRARGLELLSAEDLIQACHMLEKLNLPIRLCEFDSGVKVLQLQSHSDANVVKNTALALEDQGSLTAEELAQTLGSSLAVLPIDDCGRKSKTMPLLHAHTDTVTDMDFSPFHDGLLATGSQDCLVKLWHIPEKGLEESLCNAECTFSHKQRRVETVCFHPTADCLLTTTSYTTLTLWDISSEKELLSNAEHSDVIQSLSWKKDGTLLATSCKDKQVRILDPRLPANCFTHTANSHQSIKDSRVVWLGDTGRILTTGFDSGRQREVFIRDLRSFEDCEKALVLDSSTGILIPLYDPDTGMLFLAGKGDTTISYLEVTDREPYLIEGIRHNGEQTKGACLVPKRALAVMQGEVNRLLQLTSSSVIPIMYQVPRKSYRDFHADLFPDTTGCEAQLSAAQWLQGHNASVPRISLDPAKRSSGEITIQPRLGPKPFTPPKLNFSSSGSGDGDIKGTTEFSFDKVFSVPVAPGHETMNGALNRHGNSLHTVHTDNSGTKQSLTYIENDFQTKGDECRDVTFKEVVDDVLGSPSKDSLGPHEDEIKCVVGLLSENAVERDDQPNSRSSEDLPPSSQSRGKPKTPSTAERRKLYEKRISSMSGEQDPTQPAADTLKFDDADDKVEDFERSSVQRSSIAERRRMYENRSVSAQEAGAAEKRSPTLSPTPLRRQDSCKSSKASGQDMVKEDMEGKRSHTVQRQHSQEQLAAAKTPSQDKKPEPVTTPTPKRTSTVFGRVSKFRHLKGTPLHKSTYIENIRNVSRQLSGECDGFHANPERVAVPLSGPGGKIAVFELSRTGRLPDGVIPTLVHGTNIMDFAWDPFNCKRLAVACDDGTIRLWLIPEEGLAEPTNEPNTVLAGHSEKIYFIKFHPLAKDVLASGSYDMTVRIWDLETQTERIVLEGHTDQMFSLAWSPSGAYCATVSRDSKLRVYKPRSSSQPVREGKGPVGSRGARVVWALEGHFIVVMGFDKVSERQIQVFKADSLSVPLNTVGLDVSPAILIPFYDEDSSTLFLTGKGDSTIYAFEVTEEAPYLCPLSHHRCNTLHQGLSFLPKSVCDVSNVEFARALRLTNNTIEPLSFTVPRIKSDLFQDDLFPPTKVTWKPTLTSAQWFQGMDKLPPRQSLKPHGMECLSEVQGAAGGSEKPGSKTPGNTAASGSSLGSQQSYSRLGWNADINGATKEKQEQIQRAVSSKMEVNLKLEQDEMEGVDEREWED